MIRIEPVAGEPATYCLRTTQHFPRPRAEVFAFFADAMNLEQITPPWLRFRVLTPPPITMRTGALIDYRLRLHGAPIRWRTRISAWEPGSRFVDEQARGPYRLWRHEHLFEDDDAGGARVTDRIVYRPLGGRLAQWLLVASDLRKIFEFRRHALAERFSETAPRRAVD